MLDDFTSQSTTIWQGNIQRDTGKFPDGRTGANAVDLITTDNLSVTDWSKYSSLQITFYNASDENLVGRINLYDKESLVSPELDYGDFVGREIMFAEGITHLVVRIKPIMTDQGTRMLDITNIARVGINIPETPGGHSPIIITSMRLADTPLDIDELADAKPGDSISVVRHLNISCYTYQPENYIEPDNVTILHTELENELQKLNDYINIASLSGKKTQYHEIAQVAATVALHARPMLPWHFSPRAKLKNYSEALGIVRKERHDLEDELNGHIRPNDNYARQLPQPIDSITNTGGFKIDGKYFVNDAGQPQLLCSMNYHTQGPLRRFFDNDGHRTEICAVGGGTRYDVENSPVYEAFHKYENTHRVGWRGWCGHLIKDQWSMGGRKENVIICLESPHILKAISEYNRLRAPGWVSNSNFMYVILAYELTYICFCEESFRRFRVWLKQRHTTIENLNDKWSTSYKSFDQATPPQTKGFGPVLDANRAAWFDWADWNTRRFTDHLKWTKTDVRKLHPTIPLCAGGTHSMMAADNSVTGIDEEMIINEVDDVILHEGNDLLTIDLYHAISDKPKPIVDPEHGADCRRWFLNYFHGKSIIAKFNWPKGASREYYRQSLTTPMQGTMSINLLAEHLCVALDIRRLKNEIIAFWDQPKQIAILYSKTNMLQVPPALISAKTSPYLAALRLAFDSARCLDTATTFISERQILANKSDQFKLIILPATRHISPEIFDKLDAYVNNGGTIIILPESLIADQYNRPADYLSRWGIKIDSTEVPGIKGLGELEQGYDQNFHRDIIFGTGRTIEAAESEITFNHSPMRTSGLFQSINVKDGRVIAQGPDNQPMLVQKKLGKGSIWIVAGTPDQASLESILDHLYNTVEINRPLKVTDSSGKRIPGLEARLLRREHDDLVYLVNESGHDTDFVIKTDRDIHRVRELRSLNDYDTPTGRIASDQTLLFSLMDDTIRPQAPHEN